MRDRDLARKGDQRRGWSGQRRHSGRAGLLDRSEAQHRGNPGGTGALQREEELLEGRDVAHSDIEQHVMVPAHGVSAQHLGALGERGSELRVGGVAVLGERGRDEGLHPQPDMLGRNNGADRLDHSSRTETLDPADRCGRRELDATSQLDVRKITLLLEGDQDRTIFVVDVQSTPTDRCVVLAAS